MRAVDRVAGGDVEVAGGVPVHRAAEAGGAVDLGHPVEDHALGPGHELLGRRVVGEARDAPLAGEREPVQARAELLGRIGRGGAELALEVRVVLDVEVRAPVGEVRVQREAEHAVLGALAARAEHLEVRDLGDLGRVLVIGAGDARIPHVDRAAALADAGDRPVGGLRHAREAGGATGVEHAPVGGRRERVDLARVRRQPVRVGRREAGRGVVGVDRGLAVAADMPAAHWIAPSSWRVTAGSPYAAAVPPSAV